MITTPLLAMTTHELVVLIADHMAYCRDNTGAIDWHARRARAQELAAMLPDTPLETQVQLYEVRS